MQLPIRRKLFFSHFLAVLLVSGSIGTYFYFSAAESLMSNLQTRLQSSAALISQALDAGELSGIRGPQDITTAAYQHHLGMLRLFRSTNPDIAFIYIMRRAGTRVSFVVDSDTTPAQALPGREYTAVTPSLMEGFDHPSVDRQIYRDEWGAFLSGYAPLRNSDGKMLLGLDMRANEVEAKFRQLRLSGVLSLVFSIVLALLFSRLLTDHFNTPISLLIARCSAIADGRLNERVEFRTGDELDNLILAFNTMSEQLERMRERNREAEAELRESRDQLEVRVADRTRDLSALNDKLRHEVEERRRLEEQAVQAQKLESLGVLAAGLGHDFNNLLVGILGNVQLLINELPPDSERVKYLQDIRESGLRAADLTNQLLSYAGKGHFVLEQVNLNQLLEAMAPLLKSSISKLAAVQYRFKTELPVIQADPSQIRQVIMNLITNASEAIGEQKGNIIITTSTVVAAGSFFTDAVLKEPTPPGLYVVLSFEDNGCGIDPGIMGRIFDPFFSTKFAGRGLGLPAVLGIVRSCHGNLRVISQPDSGSTFTVYFPASPDPTPPPAKPAARSVEASLLGRHFLVVDDEKEVRNLCQRVLTKAGCAVATAHNGVEAVRLIGAGDPAVDFVLLDVTMPEMNGEETLRLLQEMRPELPVILISGYHEQEALKPFRHLKYAGFLQKPFMPEDLLGAIQRVLPPN